jgi:hypothetical protein
MMIAPVIRLCQLALAVNRPPKFTTPNDQRVIQEPTRFQILYQPVRALIDILALARQTVGSSPWTSHPR